MYQQATANNMDTKHIHTTNQQQIQLKQPANITQSDIITIEET